MSLKENLKRNIRPKNTNVYRLTLLKTVNKKTYFSDWRFKMKFNLLFKLKDILEYLSEIFQKWFYL